MIVMIIVMMMRRCRVVFHEVVRLVFDVVAHWRRWPWLEVIVIQYQRVDDLMVTVMSCRRRVMMTVVVVVGVSVRVVVLVDVVTHCGRHCVAVAVTVTVTVTACAVDEAETCCAAVLVEFVE